MDQLKGKMVDAIVAGGLQSYQVKSQEMADFLRVPRISRTKEYSGEFGLSNCAYIKKAFDTKAFVEAKATPGLQNLCKSVGVEVTEDNVPFLLDPFNFPADEFWSDVEEEEPMELDNDLYPFVKHVKDAIVEEEMEAMDEYDQQHSCSNIPDIEENESVLDNSINEEIQKLVNFNYDIIQDQFSYNKRYMSRAEAEHLAHLLHDRVEPSKLLTKFRWLKYNPVTNRAQCGICEQYTDIFKLGRNGLLAYTGIISVFLRNNWI